MTKLKNCGKAEPDDRLKIGTVFGKLTVIEEAIYVRKTNGRKKMVMVLCECGVKKLMMVYPILSGRDRACGCMKFAGNRTTHGMTHTKEYQTWAHIKRRCYVKKDKSYPRYGGSGIKMHSSWFNSFETFFKDVGPAPLGDNISIDRYPDKNGNYEPTNVRWADVYQQANNKNYNILVVIDGVEKTLKQWCNYYDTKYHTVWARISNGWDAVDAIIKPIKRLKRRANNGVALR